LYNNPVDELRLPYGTSELTCPLPPGLDITELTGRPMPVLDDPVGEVRRMMRNPVGRPPLATMCEGRGSAVITVSDHTRYYAYEVWLPAVLDELNEGGLKDDQIAVYVSSGTHRNMTEQEKRERYGPAVVDRVAVLDHDCDNAEQMVKVGRTDFGTTVLVDRRVYEADVVVMTGAVNYHYFAGYSGGRKSVIPGVCARETIRENHIRAIDQETGDFAENVQPGVLVGNPVHEDMHEVCLLVRPDFCINTVIDANRRPAWFGAGDFGYVHRIGAEWLDSFNKLALERGGDIALISSGGHPKDLTLFQAHKSLRHTSYALNDGAAVVWAAKCAEGEGPAGMVEWRGLNLEQCMQKVKTSPSLVSFCSLSLKQLARRFDVHLVSELPEKVVEGWGMTPHRQLGKAIGAAVKGRHVSGKWLVGRDMGNILPQIVEGGGA
jgi:nickel-dependent lactate racemase